LDQQLSGLLARAQDGDRPAYEEFLGLAAGTRHRLLDALKKHRRLARREILDQPGSPVSPGLEVKVTAHQGYKLLRKLLEGPLRDH
jgi:hypothetical protein